MRTPSIASAFLVLVTVATTACGDLTSLTESSRPPIDALPRTSLHLAPQSGSELLQRRTGRGRARIVLSTTRAGGRAVTLPDRESEVELVSDSGRVYALIPESGSSPAGVAPRNAPSARLAPSSSSPQLQYLDTSGGSILVQISDADGVAVYPTTDGSFSELVDGFLVTYRLTGVPLATGSPSWQIRQYTNGALASSAEYLWTRIVGGWRLDRIRVRSYAASGALVTDAVLKVATMTMMVEAPSEREENTTFASAFGASWGRACDIAGALLLPAPLQAQGSCAPQLRHQLLSIVGLVASAAMGNPLTFFASAAHTIGATYDWAACMERKK